MFNLVDLLIAQHPMAERKRKSGSYAVRRTISRTSPTSLKKLDRINRIFNGTAADTYGQKTAQERLREARAKRAVARLASAISGKAA